MNLVKLLQQQAEVRPDAIALVEGTGASRRTCTYAELEERSARGATLLRESGLKPKDVVLVAQPVSIQLYVLLASILRAGLVAMLPDPTADRDHLKACCQRRPPDAFVGPPKAHLLRMLMSEVRDIPQKFVTGGWWLPGATRWRSAGDLEPLSITERADEDPALLTFTSGTTGQPKAAVRSHHVVRSQYDALRDVLKLEAGSSVLSTLPVFVLAHLAAGMTSILPAGNSPETITQLKEQIATEKPEQFEGSPAILEGLLEEDAPLESLREVATGGAPVFPGLLHDLHERIPQSELLILYGSTEAEPMTMQRYRDISDKDWERMSGQGGLLVGSPCEAVELSIIQDKWGSPINPISNAEFEDLKVPAGKTGEIVVTGPHVLKGYLGGIGDAETKFRVDGAVWHRTGDAGYVDSDGRIWLMGPCSARIDDRKGRLYPLPVISAARMVDGVAEAALLSRNGRRLLVVERDAHHSLNEEVLLDRISWAEIDEVRVIEKMPKDRRHHSKIEYPKLKEMV